MIKIVNAIDIYQIFFNYIIQLLILMLKLINWAILMYFSIV